MIVNIINQISWGANKLEYKTVLKKVFGLMIIGIVFILSTKLFMFYIPFLIAYIISLLVEPLIKWVHKKTDLSRKTSSVIVLITVFAVLLGFVAWATFTLISESTNLLGALNTYLEKAIDWIHSVIKSIDMEKLAPSEDIKQLIQTSSEDIVNRVIEFLKNTLTGFLESLKSIPTILIYTVITILATYFITSDKIYIWDRMEHHVPKKILGKISTKVEKITASLGGYLKAEMTLIGISFVIVLMGLNIFYLMGMNVGYPLLMALFIGFVDALPILGSGTVMIPWSVILFLNQEYSVGIAILGLYIFTSIVRQFVEPKIVSSKIGIHPLFTLIAMYTGYKVMGIMGMLIGPIVLIILKNIFENTIDKGIVKSILEE